VAIQYPLGYLLGQPGDDEGQTAVLRAALAAAVSMDDPGTTACLPYKWPASARRLNAKPRQTPPIGRYLMRHPWHIPNLFARDVPASKRAKQKAELVAA